MENYNTRNLPEVLGLGAAVTFYNQIGSAKIHQRSFELKEYFRSRIASNPSFKLKTPAADDLSGAIQVVEVLGKDVRTIKEQLFDQYQIDCRPMTTFDLNALRFSCLLYTSPSPRDATLPRMPSSA